jgi:hypothetical protein
MQRIVVKKRRGVAKTSQFTLESIPPPPGMTELFLKKKKNELRKNPPVNIDYNNGRELIELRHIAGIVVDWF